MSWRDSISLNDSTSQFSATFTGSPSIRGNTSRYVNRLQDSILSQSILNSTNQHNESQMSFLGDTTLQGSPNNTLVNNTLESSIFTTRSDGNTTLLTSNVTNNANVSPNSIATESWTTLCHQFMDAMEKHSQEDDVFDLAKESENICSDHLNIYGQIKRQRAGIRIDGGATVPNDVLSMLKFERNSWRLARILYNDRILNPNQEQAMDIPGQVFTDNAIIDRLYSEKSLTREMQLVVDWAEQNYLEDIEKIEAQDNIQFYSEGPHYWEHTLHGLTTKQNRTAFRQTLDTCSQMDPDAYHRTGKEIHQQDKEDEIRVMRYIFRNLRSGKLDLGRQAAQKLGYHWLAAALQGWMLHNEILINESTNEITVEGNARRDLWKYACWSSSGNNQLSLMEKAIFGFLSGNVNAVLPACTTWEDQMWAYFRCSIDTQIEQELRTTDSLKPVTARTAGKLIDSPRYSIDLPNEYWSNMKTSSEILQEISCHFNDYNWTREEKFHFFVQVYLIQNDIDGLLNTLCEYVNENNQGNLMSTKLRPQLLRFSAHLVLFLRNTKQITTHMQEKYFSSILEAYIDYLIEKKYVSLVAPYVAQMPADAQVYCYAKLLRDITDKQERKKCLQAAREKNLDVERITQSVVETMRSSSIADTIDSNSTARVDISIDGIHSNPLTDVDRRLIRSLEWFSVENIQFIEMLRQSNALIRSFILNGKIDAAKEVYTLTPHELISAVRRAWKKKTGASELSPDLTNQTKQHLCWDALFRALESFQDWLILYNQGKPVKPSRPTSNKFCDKIGYENLEQTYAADLSKWQSAVSHQAKFVASKIMNILEFPDSGWLQDSQVANVSRKEADISQSQELITIRRRFIPQLAFLYHSILHKSGCYHDAIAVVKNIVSVLTKLHEEFTQDQLKQLMRKIRDSSVAAMNEGYDSLGYANAHCDDDQVE